MDRHSYLPLREKLRDELETAEMALMESRFDDIDIDAALAASGEVLLHAAELWQSGTLSQKQKLQAAIFPDGLTHDGQKFRTVTTCLVFSELMKRQGDETKMASPRGIELMWMPELKETV